MLKLIGKRFLMVIPQFIILSFLVFLLASLFGFSGNDSIFVRYWRWLTVIITTGDFGRSLNYGESAMAVVFMRLPNTIRLSLITLLLVYGIGFPLGIMSGKSHGGLKDQIFRVFTIIGTSFPSFALAMLLLLLFGFILRWLPTGGSLPPGMTREAVGFSMYHMTRIRHMILPAFSLAIAQFVIPMKHLKSEIVDTYQQEFVALARAKGGSEAHIFKRHIFKNSLGSILSSVPMQISAVIGGSIIVESIFAFPGLGGEFFWALLSGDLSLASASIFILGLIVILGAFISDLMILILNPRIQN